MGWAWLGVRPGPRGGRPKGRGRRFKAVTDREADRHLLPAVTAPATGAGRTGGFIAQNAQGVVSLRWLRWLRLIGLMRWLRWLRLMRWLRWV